LQFTQTDQYDPNPRPRIKLREWHLTAKTTRQLSDVEFVAVYRPHRDGESLPRPVQFQAAPGEYRLTAQVANGTASITLPRPAAGPDARITVRHKSGEDARRWEF
jgi:hypothetical protein